MNSELVKSLNVLIDETLEELEELKKSRFSASEVKLDGPGSDGIAGKPANGSLGKEEDDKKKDDDKKDKEEAKKAEGTNEQAAKAEGTNEQAAKADDEDDDDDSDDKDDDKKPFGKKEDKDDEDDMYMEQKMKKSQDEMTSLMKSFVDERIKPLEDKLSTIVDLVNKIADQPVAPKGFTARAVVPLSKSAYEFTEGLTKSAVTSKLWELKKSGTPVDSLDVTKAEMGQDLESIAKKYKIS